MWVVIISLFLVIPCVCEVHYHDHDNSDQHVHLQAGAIELEADTPANLTSGTTTPALSTTGEWEGGVWDTKRNRIIFVSSGSALLISIVTVWVCCAACRYKFVRREKRRALKLALNQLIVSQQMMDETGKLEEHRKSWERWEEEHAGEEQRRFSASAIRPFPVPPTPVLQSVLTPLRTPDHTHSSITDLSLAHPESIVPIYSPPPHQTSSQSHSGSSEGTEQLLMMTRRLTCLYEAALDLGAGGAHIGPSSVSSITLPQSVGRHHILLPHICEAKAGQSRLVSQQQLRNTLLQN